MTFPSIDELEVALRDASYLPDRGLATALFLALKLEKPLLLEGEAGVGKTEAAKAIARVLGSRLIRLQCGFCTPGMIMASVELVGRGELTALEIREGLDGNLCRCTGYENIVRAVEAASRG